jgi:hypothetical protein
MYFRPFFTFTTTALLFSGAVADGAYQERYDGGYKVTNGKSLRVATGGAGESGLLKAWATKFIAKSVSEGTPPFYVCLAIAVQLKNH